MKETLYQSARSACNKCLLGALQGALAGPQRGPYRGPYGVFQKWRKVIYFTNASILDIGTV